MKKIIFYTGCQGLFTELYLKKILDELKIKHEIIKLFNLRIIFRNQFNIFKGYNLELLKYDYNKDIEVEEMYDILKQTDIFIYNPIHKNFGIYSTDLSVKNNILSKLNENCIKISFPFTYNQGFYPFIPYTNYDDLIFNIQLNRYLEYEPVKYNNKGIKYHRFINPNKKNINYKGIEPILKLKKKGLSLEEILKMYDNNEIDFEYEKKFQKYIKILQEYEKECDIKISDFIIQNRFKKRLFLCSYHICSNIMIHITNQILDILKDSINQDGTKRLDPFDDNINENMTRMYKSPLCSYDINFLKLNREPHPEADNYYKNHIKKIYNNILEIEEQYLFN